MGWKKRKQAALYCSSEWSVREGKMKREEGKRVVSERESTEKGVGVLFVMLKKKKQSVRRRAGDEGKMVGPAGGVKWGKWHIFCLGGLAYVGRGWGPECGQNGIDKL